METIKKLQAEQSIGTLAKYINEIKIKSLEEVMELINKRFPECSCFKNEIEKVYCHKCWLNNKIKGTPKA